jgi:hypothetical protein
MCTGEERMMTMRHRHLHRLARYCDVQASCKDGQSMLPSLPGTRVATAGSRRGRDADGGMVRGRWISSETEQTVGHSVKETGWESPSSAMVALTVEGSTEYGSTHTHTTSRRWSCDEKLFVSWMKHARFASVIFLTVVVKQSGDGPDSNRAFSPSAPLSDARNRDRRLPKVILQF